MCGVYHSFSLYALGFFPLLFIMRALKRNGKSAGSGGERFQRQFLGFSAAFRNDKIGSGRALVRFGLTFYFLVQMSLF